MKKAAILVLVFMLGLTGCSTVTNVGRVNDLITEGDQAYVRADVATWIEESDEWFQERRSF